MKKTQLTSIEAHRLHEVLERVPFARLLGIHLEEVERGSATFYLDMRDELAQTEGLMHGGAVASLIDTAAAFAVMTLLERGQKTATVDFTIHYLRPVTQGRIKARARVLREGRRLVSISVEVADEVNTLTATALTTYVKRTGNR